MIIVLLTNGQIYWLHKWEVDDTSFDIGPRSLHLFSPELLLFITTLTMDFDTSNSLSRSRASKTETFFSNSSAVEILEAVLVGRSAQYRTTASDDEELLRDVLLQGRYRMAVEVRLGEKNLLVEALEEVRKASRKFAVAIANPARSTSPKGQLKKRRKHT